MGYILDPSEVNEWIGEVTAWLELLEERYRSGLAIIKEFSESEDLEGKAYNKMKEDFLTYHSLAVHGAAEAKESIQHDLVILGETIGTEYLDEDLLDEQIENQKRISRHYDDVLDQLYHLSRIPFFDYYLEPLIRNYRNLLEQSEDILALLKEKLEQLYDIGNSTRFLFDNAYDWFSAVSSAIEDLQVTITGEGNLSNGSWKSLLIPSYEEKVGKLENFKGGNEWNGYTIKEKINRLRDMIEETNQDMPKERREWIENEIRKIIPHLTPEERETYKIAMKECGLKYDEIGLAWDELTVEGKVRKIKRTIERTTESMPKERAEGIEAKVKELLPCLSGDEKRELKTAMKVHGLKYDEGGSGYESEGMYGKHTEKEYQYLLAIGGEQTTYEGFVAVAYVVLNRMEKSGKPIEQIVTPGQFHAFNRSEMNNPRNEDIAKAALDVLQGNVNNPIGDATQFRGKINDYDIWVESSKCTYAKEVGGNVFFTDEDFHYVHNMQLEKTDDAIIIYDHVTGTWKRGLIIGKE